MRSPLLALARLPHGGAVLSKRGQVGSQLLTRHGLKQSTHRQRSRLFLMLPVQALVITASALLRGHFWAESPLFLMTDLSLQPLPPSPWCGITPQGWQAHRGSFYVPGHRLWSSSCRQLGAPSALQPVSESVTAAPAPLRDCFKSESPPSLVAELFPPRGAMAALSPACLCKVK